MNAPVTYLPNYLPDPQDIFDILWAQLDWEQREGAPRREYWQNRYDMPYTYGQGEFARTYAAKPYHPLIRIIQDHLNAPAAWDFDCCFVNGYEHGRQHLGWHADDSAEMDHSHPIAVISLGAERDIMFRERDWDANPKATMGSPQFHVERQLLANGSLLVMHADMQRNWQHRIPKSSVADCGPRLSLTYRKLVV